MQQLLKYYVCGHTAKGYVNYLTSNLPEMKQAIILQGGEYQDITTLFNQLVEEGDEHTRREIMYAPHAIDSIGGILLQNGTIAILHESIVQNPILQAIYINVDDYYQEPPEKVSEDSVADLYKQSYYYLKKGLMIHDKLEKIYVREMDFAKADKAGEQFIKETLEGLNKRHDKGIIKKRLFGTNTLDGLVNIVPEVLETVENRVYIKGRAGTGKSVFMKKFWQACEELGLDLEIYYCSFDPNSIDMVLVRELNMCIFDSTDPHEFFPQHKNDKVIDLYEIAVTPGTDEHYHQDINRLTKAYKTEVKIGIEKLKKIKALSTNPASTLDITAVKKEISKFI